MNCICYRRLGNGFMPWHTFPDGSIRYRQNTLPQGYKMTQDFQTTFLLSGVYEKDSVYKLVCIFGRMNMLWALLRKEWMIEWRQKHALAGVLLYVLATVFVCYLGFQRIESAKTWGVLLWISGLFTAFNAMQKTFASESTGTQLFIYTLVHPRYIILSKAIYNAIFVAILNMLSVLLFLLFFGSEMLESIDWIQFMLGLMLGITGLGLALTFVAGLAFKSEGGVGLVAILGFPVIMPLLITIVRHSTAAIEGVSMSQNSLNLVVLFVLNVLSFVLSYVLFPYLWRE